MGAIQASTQRADPVTGFQPVHYRDTFSAEVRREQPIAWEELAQAFRKAMPWWAIALLGLRNVLFGWTGLKTRREGNPEGFGLLDLFKTLGKTDDTAVLGQEDRHLDFRVVVHLRNGDEVKAVDVTTLVRFNRREGRIYFFFVKPFHRLIVRSMTRRTAEILRHSGA